MSHWFGVAPVKKRALESHDEMPRWLLNQMMKLALTTSVCSEEDKDAPWNLLYDYCMANVSASSYAVLSFLSENGLGGLSKDALKAVEYRVQAANMGHAGSAYRLAMEGSSELERCTWLRIASANGNLDARYELGKAYWKGRGVSKDNKEALQCFIQCGNQPKALRLRAEILFEQKDLREAYDLFAQAAAAGDMRSYEAMANLLGRPEFEASAVERSLGCGFLQHAALADISSAAACLGHNYLHGSKFAGISYEENFELAVGWYEKAAALGNVKALGRLGECHECAYFYPKNIAKAFEFYEKGAAANDFLSLSTLGEFYLHGQKGALEDGKSDLKADPIKGFQLIQRASEHPLAQKGEIMFVLGNCHMAGTGTPRNLVEGIKCWKTSAQADYAKAKQALREYYMKEAEKYSED